MGMLFLGETLGAEFPTSGLPTINPESSDPRRIDERRNTGDSALILNFLR
jgi:hypothetical protein